MATGPLTSDTLAAALRARLGTDALAFYDAIAPVIDADTIDTSVVFRAARYDKETFNGETGEEREEAGEPEGAYINCPLTRDQYLAFLDALRPPTCITGTSSIRRPTSRGVCQSK